MPEHMHLGSRALAAVLGGPGVFYVVHSFQVPTDALKGVIFLGAATAINLLLYPEVVDVDAVGRLVAKLGRIFPRR